MNTASPCDNISDHLNSPSGPILDIYAGSARLRETSILNWITYSVFGTALHSVRRRIRLKEVQRIWRQIITASTWNDPLVNLSVILIILQPFWHFFEKWERKLKLQNWDFAKQIILSMTSWRCISSVAVHCMKRHNWIKRGIINSGAKFRTFSILIESQRGMMSVKNILTADFPLRKRF